jgi:hypothetical protein
MSTVEQCAEFEAETMQRMIDALAKTGRVLRLSDRQPGLPLVATRRIIELAKSGEREAERDAMRANEGPSNDRVSESPSPETSPTQVERQACASKSVELG